VERRLHCLIHNSQHTHTFSLSFCEFAIACSFSSDVAFVVVCALCSTQKLDLLVEVGDLQLPGLQNEPLFCTLALHDIKKRQRLTEDFHFELNIPSEEPDVWTTRRALFTLTGEPNEAIYLVLRIHRLFQDDEKEKSGNSGFNLFGLLRRRKVLSFSFSLHNNTTTHTHTHTHTPTPSQSQGHTHSLCSLRRDNIHCFLSCSAFHIFE
jgi:hypothetical protein